MRKGARIREAVGRDWLIVLRDGRVVATAIVGFGAAESARTGLRLQSVPLRLRGPKPREDDFEPQTFGEHVRKRRLVLGRTKKRVAAQLGVTGATVSHWESGETPH